MAAAYCGSRSCAAAYSSRAAANRPRAPHATHAKVEPRQRERRDVLVRVLRVDEPASAAVVSPRSRRAACQRRERRLRRALRTSCLRIASASSFLPSRLQDRPRARPRSASRFGAELLRPREIRERRRTMQRRRAPARCSSRSGTFRLRLAIAPPWPARDRSRRARRRTARASDIERDQRRRRAASDSRDRCFAASISRTKFGTAIAASVVGSSACVFGIDRVLPADASGTAAAGRTGPGRAMFRQPVAASERPPTASAQQRVARLHQFGAARNGNVVIDASRRVRVAVDCRR